MPKLLSPRNFLGEYDVRAFGAKGDGTTDDTAAINAALQKCYDDGGGTVRLPPGEYETSAPLIIRSDTNIECSANVRVFRTASGALLMNGEYDEDQSVYTGHGNIRVRGGVWDMRGTVVTNKNIGLAFAHGQNITIQDVTVKDVPGNHAIEINSSQTVRILNSRFLGYYDVDGASDPQYNEAIQIDLALTGGSTFGAFGLYDDTPCDDVVVDGCYFGPSGTASTIPWYRGVGSHSGKAGFEHTNVRITNNHFDGLRSVAIPLYGYRRTIVANNVFDGCGAMVYANSASNQDISDITITGNVAKDLSAVGTNGSPTAAGLPAITVAPSTGTAYNIVISGNAIDGVNGTSGHGVDMARCTYVNLSGNTFANVGCVGVRFVGGCTGIAVTGNTISGTGDAGMQITNTDACVVNNNLMRATAKSAMYCTQSTDLVIQGNSIVNPGQIAGTWYGIQLSGTGTTLSNHITNFNLSSNRIRKNSGSGTVTVALMVSNYCTGGYFSSNDSGGLTETLGTNTKAAGNPGT